VEHVFGGRAKSFIFDPVQDLYGERSDPDLFLRNNPPPLILDEIQYVPELVPAIKRCVDRLRHPGCFVITGSQQWQVMRRLSESLAGRVAVLELPGFSLGEGLGDPGHNWFAEWLTQAVKDHHRADEVVMKCQGARLSPAELVWRGSYPGIQPLAADLLSGWMRGYITTYLQRDVRLLLDVRDEAQFGVFLGLCAALTARECNWSQMGRDVSVSTPTARKWTDALKGTFQWAEIPAFGNNQVKRLSQKPKGYLTDTGLACYLMRISSPEALQGHPSFGALFETWVVMELIKQTQVLDTAPVFHHYRLHSGSEVDLVAELDGRAFPIEIKASSRVRAHDANGIVEFQKRFGNMAGDGLVVYGGDQAMRLGERCTAIPFDARLPL